MRDEGLSSPYPHAVCYGKTATDMSLMMMVMVRMVLMMMMSQDVQDVQDVER